MVANSRSTPARIARGQKPRASYGKWTEAPRKEHGKTQCFRHSSISLRPRSGDAAPACPGFLTRCPEGMGIMLWRDKSKPMAIDMRSFGAPKRRIIEYEDHYA